MKKIVLPSVSPDSSPSDINSSSEQMLRILTSISVTAKIKSKLNVSFLFMILMGKIVTVKLPNFHTV